MLSAPKQDAVTVKDKKEADAAKAWKTVCANQQIS